jgi:hypothetical protein
LKTIIKLLIVAVVLHACYQGGAASWKYYSFKDAAAQAARFGGAETETVLHERILGIAEELEVEIHPDDLQISRDGLRTTVAAAYFDDIPVVPSLYTHEQLWEFEVTVNVVRPLTGDDDVR